MLTVAWRSFANVSDSIFACTISTKRAPCEFVHPKNKPSGRQEQQVFVAMEFTDQVTFVELKLLWNQYIGNKIVIMRCLRYYGDNILGPCYNSYIYVYLYEVVFW